MADVVDLVLVNLGPSPPSFISQVVPQGSQKIFEFTSLGLPTKAAVVVAGYSNNRFGIEVIDTNCQALFVKDPYIVRGRPKSLITSTSQSNEANISKSTTAVVRVRAHLPGPFPYT